MRRLPVLGVALAVLALAAPAGAADWAPPDSGAAPTYAQPIQVFDTLRGTITDPAKKQKYTAERNDALNEWGIGYDVFAYAESNLPYLFDENIGTNGIDGILQPHAVIILRNYLDCSNQGGWSVDVDGGSVILCPWSGWWDGFSGTIRSALAHEYGHALGFNHGGTGVMDGAAHVNDEERSLAAAYYGG